MPARLILYKDNQKLGMELKDGVYRVGRAAPADIVIADGTLSSNHAELQVKASTCLVRDLGSTNGTFVNGKQIASATPVRETDELRFGGIVVKIQFPQEIKPLDQGPGVAAQATEKMEAAKQAAGRLGWTTRYWIAGLWPILFMTFLVIFILGYTENANSKYRLVAQYDSLASQYVHVLRGERQGPIPAPLVGGTFDEPLMVIDKDGKVLFPVPPEGANPIVSPVINPKTKAVYENAKYGLFTLPGTAEDGKDEARSYPVRSGGDLLGFVVARPVTIQGGTFGSASVMVFLTMFITLLILTFTLRPVHALVRASIENLRNKLSPLVNGFVDSLPRTGTVPEMNGLAEEIEKSIAQARSEAAGGSSAAGGKRAEYVELLGPLVDAVGVAYCFVSSDFKLLSRNQELTRITEFGRTGTGDSIFEGGLSSIQAKQLVQTIAEARSSNQAVTKIELAHDGQLLWHDVAVRAFQDPATRAQIYGIVLNRAT